MARSACQKAMMAFRRVVFALTNRTKMQARTFTKTKAERRTKKEKAKKELIPNPDSQPQKQIVKKDVARLGNQTLLVASHWTDLGCTRSIGSRAAIEILKKHAWYYGTTTEFCRCNKSLVFANSETETCMESCSILFPTTPPCSTKV